MQNAVTYYDAKRHVERKIGFYIHLTVYVIVNSGLLFVNLTSNSRVLWAIAPLLGWGIGLLFHGLGVFLHSPGSTWKQRMIEKELNNHNHTKPPSA